MDKIFDGHFVYERIKTPGFPFAHCSNITQLDNEWLIAQWYTGKGEGVKNQSIFASKYNIIKNQWQEPFLLSKSTKFPEGNGVIWKDSSTNRLFLFYATMWTDKFAQKMFGRGWFYCKLFYKISEDKGKNWSPAKIMKDELGSVYRNKPILLKSGRILVPIYQEIPPQSYIAISDDHGDSFRFSSLILDDPRFKIKSKRNKISNFMEKTFGGAGNSQPTLIELDNGNIIALMRTKKYRKIFRSISEDSGETWNPAAPINLPNPDSGIDMVKLQSGKFLLIFNNSESGRHNLSLAICKDGEGVNWKVVKVLENNPKMRFSYPSIIQLLSEDGENQDISNGMIHATYTYNRKTIKHIFFNEEWLQN